MALQGLVELVSQSKEFEVVKQRVAAGEQQLLVGLSGSQKNLLVAATANPKKTTLYITFSHQQAEATAQDLRTLFPKLAIKVFSPNEFMPHDEVVTDWELRRTRLEALSSLKTAGAIICTSVQALTEVFVDPRIIAEQRIAIDLDSRINPHDFSSKLVELGYERVDMIEGYGQFSIRGGIIDIFSVTDDNPIRIELFDDEVDSIRTFNVADQRSLDKREEFIIYPARELIYPKFDLEQVASTIWQEGKTQAAKLEKLGKNQEADNLLARLAAHLELLEETKHFPGIDQYFPYLTKPYSFFDYLSEDCLIVLNEPARIKEQARIYLEQNGESIANLLEQGRVLPSMGKMYWDWSDLWEKMTPFVKINLSVLDKRIPDMANVQPHRLPLRNPEHFQANMDAFLNKVSRLRKEHYRILLVVSTKERGMRLADFLRDNEIPAQYVDSITNQLKMGNCLITKGDLETGLEFPGYKLSIFTDLEIYGRQRTKKRISRPESHLKLTESDLQVADYVVHINHGIGQYLGVETLEVAGSFKDYLLVRFAGKDKLYVPTDQIDMLQRYVGLDDQEPKLSKLGGGEWARVKSRVKASVKEMAEGLIKLYAEREAIQGYAYSSDTPWQKEFEDAFPYEETPDQERAIVEVKKDMEKPKPMDRLLCGDVGYGKTEVAIRAAFKAVGESKQVAVLVPTTILAQQHHRTFMERFEDYPINIGVLSRFQSSAEQKKVVDGLKDGSVDIVIGTHRLLSKDIVYKDLGLVVVDEEQRFGVGQKERLKEICKNVDVLTLSATPIPRTLHMSMVGVRDMSLIETPPEDRFPIRTYVMEWDDQVIAQAINRELGREGQVYVVYNRVQGIDQMYKRMQNLVPEARIGIAHGQMNETRLEKIMLDFYNGEYDILLCTTIIETGMDISNVNTLIIYDADHLGLAQLYQLRGRVGRTNRMAHAYFTYRKDKILTEVAEKRLQAIKEFTELGSGIKIAMRDLEIRGAGNILGPEQHGFITSVGFELYCKLLDESIKQLKGEEVKQPPEPILDLNVSAYISDEYVPDPKQKIELYKKMIAVDTLEAVDDLEEEILDRFSDLPEAVRNLLQISRIKIFCRQVGVANITVNKDMFVIRFLTGIATEREKYDDLARKYRGLVGYFPGKSPRLQIKLKNLTEYDSLLFLAEVLETII